MAVTITTKGFIEVLRDGGLVSRHRVETEAIESALTHAEAAGPGTYTFRYPDKQVLITAKVDIYPPPAPPLPVATVLSAVSIRVDWSAVSDPAGINGYRLERSIAGGEWAEIYAGSALTYTDSALTPSTSYRYRVRAEDNEGYVGNYSTIVTAVTTSQFGWTIADTPYALGDVVIGNTVDFSQYAVVTGAAPPTVAAWTLVSGPGTLNASTGVLTTTGLTAGAATWVVDLSEQIAQVTGLSASLVTSAGLTLDWDEALFATSYHVDQSTDGVTWAQIATTTAPPYLVTGLSSATAYYFRVRGSSGVHSGPYSATVTATTLTQPGTGDFEPVLVPEAQPELYQTYDDGISSPRYNRWNPRLYLPWQNVDVGDFTDATDTAQGTTAFASNRILSAGSYWPFDVATLVTRGLTANKGFYVKARGTSASVNLAGRLSANPPLLTVVTTNGTFVCPCTAAAYFANESVTKLSVDSRTSFTINATNRRGIIRFDLSAVTGTVTSATMQLYANTINTGAQPYIDVFEANPPYFQVGLKDTDVPEEGIASLFPGDNFGSDPRVLMAGDFTGATVTAVSGIRTDYTTPNAFRRIKSRNAVAIVDDPAAPGTKYWRGQFVPITSGTDARREAFDGDFTIAYPLNTSGYPLDPATYYDDLYFRMYLMLEEDFDTTVEGNKMGITWDLRLGYWMPSDNVEGGYWQNIGGNGGNPGDGTKRYYADLRASGAAGSTTNTSIPAEPRYVYYGNMQRMEGGVATTAGPYTDLRPWLGYNYETTTALYPSQRLYGDIKPMMFRRGVWYCVEQRCRLNTIDLSSPDADGNGIANDDGLLETWINGVKVSSQGDYSWRRHPDMGIQGGNCNWYMGGQAAHPLDEGNMHFRMNHIVLATSYIGPRVKP